MTPFIDIPGHIVYTKVIGTFGSDLVSSSDTGIYIAARCGDGIPGKYTGLRAGRT